LLLVFIAEEDEANSSLTCKDKLRIGPSLFYSRIPSLAFLANYPILPYPNNNHPTVLWRFREDLRLADQEMLRKGEKWVRL